MPTYEYECTSCGYRFEKLQSIKENPIKKCPDCGKPVNRLISKGAGIIFKGRGFYQTDYKGSGKDGKPDKDKPTPPSCGNSGSCPHSCGGA